MRHLFPSFDGPTRASPYFCVQRRHRWWPVAAAFVAGMTCVFALVGPWTYAGGRSTVETPAAWTNDPRFGQRALAVRCRQRRPIVANRRQRQNPAPTRPRRARERRRQRRLTNILWLPRRSATQARRPHGRRAQHRMRRCSKPDVRLPARQWARLRPQRRSARCPIKRPGWFGSTRRNSPTAAAFRFTGGPRSSTACERPEPSSWTTAAHPLPCCPANRSEHGLAA